MAAGVMLLALALASALEVDQPMAVIRPRDLLTDELLGELGRPGSMAADLGRLADAGYLNAALPAALGGLGCTLRQAACGQRRLARHAPELALAVSAHLYWTGAAADAVAAGDDSVRWILDEAARGALIAGGHSTGKHGAEAGADLKFADPGSRCEPDGAGGYVFSDRAAATTMTPAWDWTAVHGLHVPPAGGRPQFVIGFAGRGGRCTPGFRVARLIAPGTPGDVFTTSALTWGHSILASVQYSDARRAFNEAITEIAAAAVPDFFAGPGGPAEPRVPGRVPGQGALPAGRWPVAEAGARLDAMKSRIADITHPWHLHQPPAPDLGGQHLIGLHAMRHEVAEGAAAVHALVADLTGPGHPARSLPL
jgi:hypothetical protein